MPFDLVSPYPPAGDQPRAIRELSQGLARGDRYQTLLGVTGSGKTFTMAHVLAAFNRPTLVLSHNKTLAAQLYGELKGFFPKNAVEFFISYYDYYQPEAYVPQTDTYIAKDSSINDDIDRLRLRATSSLMEREDVVIVASVSAIYGLGDTVERIAKIDPLTGNTISELARAAVYPATHFVTERPTIERAVTAIRAELKERLAELRVQNKLLEAQRLESRTNFDVDMLLEVGRCTGIENYSRHLTGRAVGERPACLLDYFPDNYLCIIDESHQTLPQLGGMFEGDRSRKQTLVDYGFRLPSALDNRPLRIDEFMGLVPRILFVSATPGEEELRLSGGVVVEQIIRPTGLVDPQVEVRPVKGQVDDLLHEIRLREKKNERVLVTTLTKRMAEDLTDYLQQHGVRVRYLHSEIDAIERVEIIRGLRLGEFDVLVGINLLREGLDLPEVSLVAVLDADQEGFLRSDRSLIQTVGRAARHLSGRAIFYADRITGSMQRCIDETVRRREIQTAYNVEHGITPKSVQKSTDQVRFITRVADSRLERDEREKEKGRRVAESSAHYGKDNLPALIAELEAQMRDAAANLDFETAARIRDELFEIKAKAGRQSESRGSLAGLHGR